MEFLLHFHINTEQKESIVKFLECYSGIPAIHTDKRTDDLLDNILEDLNADPDYYVVNQCSSHWQCVQYNSFKKLHDLGKLVSDKMNTLFIQTMYCRAIEYAYFLVYKNGRLLREIEASREDAIPHLNRGVAFPFEIMEGCDDVPDLRSFDLDTIGDYCLKLGIDIRNLWDEEYSYVLEKAAVRKTLLNIQRARLKVLWDIEREAQERLHINV